MINMAKNTTVIQVRFMACITVVLILLLTNSPVANSVEPLTGIDAFKVIMIDGSEIPEALGQPIADFSLAALIDGEMEPIPFQIDEYNTEGTVYFEYNKIPLAGTLGIIDQHDKLIFTYKDAGERRQNNSRYDGEIIQEIMLYGKGGTARYVYLVKNSRLKSDDQYVRYSADEALVETDFYSISYNKDNHISWNDFSIVGFSGNENPIDALKVRLTTGILSNFIRHEFTNDNLVATPESVHSGAIRSTTQMDLVLDLASVPLLHINLQLHHYAKSVIYDVRILIPRALRVMLVDPVLTMSLEGNNLYGAELYTASGPKQPGITDGKVDDIERLHMENGISKSDNWVLLSTNQNLDIAAFFDFSSKKTETISLHYNDDDDGVIDPPERFPGQLPNVGFKIHNLPKSGEISFVININFDKNYTGTPDEISRHLRDVPDITVLSPKPPKH